MILFNRGDGTMSGLLQKVTWLFAMILFNLFLIGCSESLPTSQYDQTPEKSLVFDSNTSGQQSRAIVESAWNTPITIDSAIVDGPFGGFPFHVSTNADNQFFATWAAGFNNVKIATRTAIGQPWDITSPNSDPVVKILRPKIYSSPQTSEVFATWNDPNQALGTAYISRYIPGIGWSSPLSFADNPNWNSKVIVANDGSAILVWLNYAENGTAELHARRFDTQGKLRLRDTLIIGEPGGFIGGVDSVNGLISANGDIELYWISTNSDFSNGLPSTSTLQVWHTTYSPSGTGATAWSQPEKIQKAKFLIDGFFSEFHIVTDNIGNMTFIIQPTESFESMTVHSLEFKNGVWGDIESLTNISPMSTNTGIGIASNSQGQAVFVWQEVVSSQPTPGVSLLDVQVFSRIYNIASGWSQPEQISNSNPIAVDGFGWGSGDEPKISINELGQIAVVWISPVERSNKNLYANHYDLITGWQGEELAATTNISANDQTTYNIKMADNGDTSIFWLETLRATDGIVSINAKSIDYVGAGNGVVITTDVGDNDVQIKSVENPLTRFNIQKQANTLVQTSNRLSITRLSNKILLQTAARSALPIGVNSAWDEPKIIGNVSEPLNSGMYINPLHIMTNDLGEATVSFFTNSVQNTLANFIWSGDILSGGWKIDTSPIASADPDFTIVRDMKLDSTTGDIYLAWGILCPDKVCLDFYVSRKFAGGIWEDATLLGRSVGGGIGLISNNSTMGATWISSTDAANNPEIAYSQFTSAGVWSAPNIFTPTPLAGAIGLLSHSPLFPISTALNDGGVLSVVSDTFSNPNTNTSLFSQYDPVNGWTQKLLPTDINAGIGSAMMGGIYLSSTDMGNSVHMIASNGLSSDQMQITSHQFINENWSPSFDITSPRRGMLQSRGIESEVSIIDSNSNGNMLVAWSEYVLEGFTPTRQVRMNQFDPVSGWGQPQDVGFPIPEIFNGIPGPIMFGAVEFLRVSLNEAGQGAIAWIDTSGQNHTLNIVHIDPLSATNTHELVYSIDPTLANFVALDLHVDSQGRTILVWDERSESATELNHVIKTTTHHTAGSIQPVPIIPPEITQPDVPAIPEQTVGWSDPAMVWEYPSAQEWNNLTLRPDVIAINSSPTVAIQINHSLDLVNKSYTASDYIVTSQQTTGLWQTSNPFATLLPDATSRVQVVNDALGQTTFVLWYSQQQLYINLQPSNGSWGVPTLVSANASNAHLLVNTQGIRFVLWQAADDPSVVSVSEIIKDSLGVLSVITSQPSIQASTTLSAFSSLKLQGKLSFLRKSTTAGSHEYILSQYQTRGNWLTPPSQSLNADGFHPDSVNLAMTSNGEVVVFAQSILTRSLQSAILQADGSWSNWTELHPGNLGSALVGEYRLGTSNTGQLYALWVEEIIDTNGEPKNNVMFSSFNGIDLSAGNPWQPATLITQIPFPNFQETPILLVGNEGMAAVVWQYPIIPVYADGILIKKYHPITGWQTAPEYAVTLSSLTGYINRINAQLSDTGNLFIVWEDIGYPMGGNPHAINFVQGTF